LEQSEGRFQLYIGVSSKLELFGTLGRRTNSQVLLLKFGKNKTKKLGKSENFYVKPVVFGILLEFKIIK